MSFLKEKNSAQGREFKKKIKKGRGKEKKREKRGKGKKKTIL